MIRPELAEKLYEAVSKCKNSPTDLPAYSLLDPKEWEIVLNILDKIDAETKATVKATKKKKELLDVLKYKRNYELPESKEF